MSDTVIKVENLSKLYRLGELHHQTNSFRDRVTSFFKREANPDKEETIWALKDVSFEVKAGEILGIIGSNGAGKSTLLKILSRITKPTEGRAFINGRVGTLLEVGTGFHPELTGRENISLSGSVLGMSKTEIRQKFNEIVEFAEIEKFIDTPIKRYSSGMYVRLAFAVAAHLDPEILLVDEVLAVGDVAFQRKCLGKMGEVSKEGRTVLFVSHNMFSIRTLCENGILIENGRIGLQGHIDVVTDTYLSEQLIQKGEVTWTSPSDAQGDEDIRIKAVRLSVNGRATSQVNLSDEFDIEIDYWTLKPRVKTFFYLRIDTPSGVFVLLSANSPSIALKTDPWFDKLYPAGIFRTSCRIPSWLLNSGMYYISVFSCRDSFYQKRATLRNIISFTIIDDGNMRKEYQGPWESIIRPRLAWETKQLGF